MLILSRKKNESIIIRDDITIMVVEIRDGKVRLGIEAPKEVPIHRAEKQVLPEPWAVFPFSHPKISAAQATAEW